MRIYVSVDLEGIHNVDKFDQHDDKNPDYQLWKKYVGQLMYEEVNVLYEGLVLKGLTEGIVFDSHAHSDTLSLSQDSPILTQVRRSRGNRVYFPSFDSSFDGIILWGYHVKAGSKDGRFGHTQTRRIMNVKINNIEVGEVYLHALYAFNKGVPFIAVVAIMN